MTDLEKNTEYSDKEHPSAAPEAAEEAAALTGDSVDVPSPTDEADTPSEAPAEEAGEAAAPAAEESAAPAGDEPAADEAAKAETQEAPDGSGGPEAPETTVAPEAPETPETPEAPETPETPAAESAPSSGLSGIRLAMELCDRVTESAGPEQFHGGVRPDNISVRDEQVYLGGALQHNVGEFTPQELEYMAPELFWDGIRTPTADVYSVGLVLYSVYNYGRLPFWPVSGAITPNARASALQKRMSDEPIVPPAKADAELSAVILRALAFRREERWHDVRELKEALSTCDESSSPVDISLAMSGLLTRSTETAAAERRPAANKSRVYYDDGEIPALRRPRRRRNLSWLWLLILGILIVGAAVLLLMSLGNKNANSPGGTDPEVVLEATPTVEPLITPTPTPEVTPTPEPTERPHGPQYAVYVEDVSWEQAVERCRELGGTLAIPASQEEYNEVVRVCTSARINYVWLGASRQADGNWITPDGDGVTFFNWGEGEPSFIDGGDGTPEDYLLMWRNDETWIYNDSRENPLQDYSWIYSGSIGFVCKMW